MVKLSDLVDIEEIKQLKARYFRTTDTMQMEEWLKVFTTDAELEYDMEVELDPKADRKSLKISGIDKIRDWWLSNDTRWQSVHHGHMPEITIVSEDEATGIWAMEDIVEFTDGFLHGFGHYHETYRRVEGAWKIARLKLTRTRVLHSVKDRSILS